MPALLFSWHARRRPNRKRRDFHFRTRFFFRERFASPEWNNPSVNPVGDRFGNGFVSFFEIFTRFFSYSKSDEGRNDFRRFYLFFYHLYAGGRGGGRAFPPSPVSFPCDFEPGTTDRPMGDSEIDKTLSITSRESPCTYIQCVSVVHDVRSRDYTDNNNGRRVFRRGARSPAQQLLDPYPLYTHLSRGPRRIRAFGPIVRR